MTANVRVVIENERIHHLSDAGICRGDRIIYWMQRSQRAEENHALEYAVAEANRLSLPLVVLICIDPGYPGAPGRAYRFMLEGLRETEERLRARKILLLPTIGDPVREIPRGGEDAALVITDRGYLRHERDWRREIAESLACPLIEVETETVVPVRLASIKEEWSAATLRRKITPQIPHYLHSIGEGGLKSDALKIDSPAFPIADTDGILKKIGKFEQKNPLVADGGREEAIRRLRAFSRSTIEYYSAQRNDPGREVTSGLSPYLHFGQISPVEVARAVSGKPGSDAFLEELIVRRELAINFVWYNPRYDGFEGLPDWPKKTLQKHAGDEREYLYTDNELRRAETHDPYWNAAQKEMLICGKMHNYMRMYWGKKILEWSESPESGYTRAILLNDAYELDGRDPNGYTGVAWCFGKHDRPWKERPVFGTVRYMNANGLKRKGDIVGYTEKIEELWELSVAGDLIVDHR